MESISFSLTKGLMHFYFILIAIFISSLSFAQDVPLHTLHLPAGFTISIYADVENARSMAMGTKGILFVSSLSAGNVYAVIPDKTGPHGTKVVRIASGLNKPNGVAFYQGSLYIAETGRILRYNQIEDHLQSPPKPVIVTQALPQQAGDHDWRYIKFGPDGKLYIAIGMPCNVCLSKDTRFGTIMRMNPDGSNMETYVKGIRNSVGFDWDPLTKQLWFTDNGRDWLGDNLPPDKLNYAPKMGMNFGFPYIDGKNLPDPIYGKMQPSQTNFSQPTLELPAHVAALGMHFYHGNMFPANYRHQIFIAEHGSWNRTHKIGYQVVKAQIQNNHVIALTPFISGWLQGEKPWGRPVDILEMNDGSLLISDDYAGKIYRVFHNK